MPTAVHTSSAAPPAPTPAPSGNGRLFTGSAASWLYSAPTGSGLDIAGITGAMPIYLNTHAAGFDYPVQYADDTSGCTTFTDKKYFDLKDRICVPNPAGGFRTSTGGYGADDGHLVVVVRSAGKYYDFWKLSVDGNGQPTSTDVGQIVEGNLDGDGTPGTTAAQISGLAGSIMPGDLDCETCLQHALSLIVPGTMNSSALGHQAPARHSDGTVAGAVFREGAKLRLDPSLNVDGLEASTAAKAIMHALQQYGGVITDQSGGNGIGIYSALDSAPDLAGLGEIAKHLWIYY